MKEAVARGFEVTAIVRGENKTVAQQVLQKDVFDLTADDVIGFDAVVDAVGALTADTVHMVPDAAKHLATILKDSQTRLLVVGGAASLYVNPERTLTVADVTEFPAEVLPVLNAHKEALEALRQVDDVNWTYVSPAGDFQADGERTGRYILGGEELVLNSKGESVISYADYAIGMIDEIATGDHLKARISLVSE